MEEVTMEKIYEELKELRNELAEIRYALIPEEELSNEEIEEILKIDKEMEEGKRVKLEDSESFIRLIGRRSKLT